MLYSTPCLALLPLPHHAYSSAPLPSTPPASTTLDPIPRGRRILEYDEPPPHLQGRRRRSRYAEKPVTLRIFSVERFHRRHRRLRRRHVRQPLLRSHAAETEEDEGRVYIKAIRNIAAGEELVYEYNLHDSDEDSADCYCGAPHCRGTMFSDEELKRRARRAKRKAVKK